MFWGSSQGKLAGLNFSYGGGGRFIGTEMIYN